MKGSAALYSQLKRLGCVLLALHFLNCSIDPRDTNPESVPEDLRINDLETVTEFLTEEIFGFTNAFAEHDENDAGAESTVGAVKFYFSNYSIVLSVLYCQDTMPPIAQTDHLLIPTRCREVSSPPPRT